MARVAGAAAGVRAVRRMRMLVTTEGISPCPWCLWGPTQRPRDTPVRVPAKAAELIERAVRR